MKKGSIINEPQNIGHVHCGNSVQMGLKNHILYVLRGEGNIVINLTGVN